MKKTILFLSMLAVTVTASAANWYLSPKGSDAKDGKSEGNALATLAKAQELAQPGDVVYILPGVYKIREDQIARTDGSYSIVFDMNKSGQQGKPIVYMGVCDKQGKRPVFDFSAVKPA